MADDDSTPNPTNPTIPDEESQEELKFSDIFKDLLADSSSSSSSDDESDSDSDESDQEDKKLPGDEDYDDDEEIPEDDNSPEANVKRFMRVLNTRQVRKSRNEDEKGNVDPEDLFNFPKDPENWREEDLQELWADAPLGMTKPGWDPNWVDDDEVEVLAEEVKAGRDPPIAPFYLPYRKSYPVIPDNNYDISNPKSVIEELDRIEEFLKWVSYIFPDGSSYEGTVWDDLAHGKGVYVAEQGLVRYEGEWLQNNPEGHGVIEVDIPDIEPVPGSKLEAKMRAEGKIISRDFMSPEDREWLEMDIEDSYDLADGRREIPFYENDEWIRQFGTLPEKGRYRYAGQWKHGRMHGCGVYELNETTVFGRFYFGEMLEDSTGCLEETSALHAGIAEVAAAKARMFINKPDGMVREQFGPYSDPQHPYLYEEDDVWMAPGFINQFYEVPDYWKTYVGEVDIEREMWLNSFYRAPLRLPMPAELEYWWSKDESPEFVLINKEPEPDPEDPSKLIYTEDPLILHTRTGRIIDYVEDEEHGLRLFWRPPVKEGEEYDPDNVEFLPLGYDEFYGRTVTVKKPNIWMRIITAVENACKPVFDKIEKWSEEKRKESEMKMKLIEKELELVEAEICLEETIEDMDEELKMMEKEEEKKVEMGLVQEDDLDTASELTIQDEGGEEEEEDEDDEVEPSSFGSAIQDDQKGSKSGKSPFSAISLSFASFSLVSPFVSTVPSRVQQSFAAPSEGIPRSEASSSSSWVRFPRIDNGRSCRLRASSHHQQWEHNNNTKLYLRNCRPTQRKQVKLHTTLEPTTWSNAPPGEDLWHILALPTRLDFSVK